jgi:hypothetical protein
MPNMDRPELNLQNIGAVMYGGDELVKEKEYSGNGVARVSICVRTQKSGAVKSFELQ